MPCVAFEIYEKPQPASPDTEKPHMENPDVDKPHVENLAQINTNLSNYLRKEKQSK